MRRTNTYPSQFLFNQVRLYYLFIDFIQTPNIIQTEFNTRKLAVLGDPIAFAPRDKSRPEDVLAAKAQKALLDTGFRTLVVAGGVGANALLREQLNTACGRRGVRVHYPELHLCTDNGAMIAALGAQLMMAGREPSNLDFGVDSTLSVETVQTL